MNNQESVVIGENAEPGLEAMPQTASEVARAEEIPSEAFQPSTRSIDEPKDIAETTSSGEPQPSPETEETSPDATSIHTLKIGQHIVGKVKNITNFGAFIDIGIPQDGLVHISKLSRRKVEKVTDVVSEGQEVDVWVKKVDKKRGRISLTMVKPVTLRLKNIKEGDELEGTVTRLETYGAFVDIGSDRDGLVHISQITHDYINHPEEALAVGDNVKVKVLKVNRKKRQVDLSIKALLPPPAPPVEEVRPVEAVETAANDEFVVEHEEPVPTAMALAYAAFQYGDQSDKQAGKETNLAKSKGKQKQEIDAIVARTLAARED